MPYLPFFVGHLNAFLNIEIKNHLENIDNFLALAIYGIQHQVWGETVEGEKAAVWSYNDPVSFQYFSFFEIYELERVLMTWCLYVRGTLIYLVRIKKKHKNNSFP